MEERERDIAKEIEKGDEGGRRTGDGGGSRGILLPPAKKSS